jgi:hypothetical protein
MGRARKPVLPPQARSSESAQQDDRTFARDRQAVQRVLLATKLRSANIKNDRNEDLGKLEDLEKAPLVKADNYKTLLAPGFAEEVRHYFGVKEERAAGGEEDGNGGCASG